MKSSKDVVDKANALLNTAAGCQNPQPRLMSNLSEKQVETACPARREHSPSCEALASASAPATHLMSPPHPGRACRS